MQFAAICMELEAMREIGQKKKDKHRMIFLICGILNDYIRRGNVIKGGAYIILDPRA